MKGIPLYKNIDELHKITGSGLRSKYKGFHCFDMAETNNLTVNALPPHRADFYTLALNSGTKDLTYSLNENTFTNPKYFILCVAPGQVVRWEKKGNWFGYCTFFKSDFLLFNSETNFLKLFPFFNISETNLISVDSAEFECIFPLFTQILSEQNRQSAFSTEVVRSLFLAVLWHVRRIYESSGCKTEESRRHVVLASQFKWFVNEYYKDKILVEEYASLLNITANHLSQVVKNATGRTAKSIITQRRLEEAKYLLTYTDDTIAAISYFLHFSEPTHFTKFFRKHTGFTPEEFRGSVMR